MRYIIIIALFIQCNTALSQTETQKQKEKPSWSSEMPEMVDAPDLKMEQEVDLDIDLDMDDLRLDRDSLFDDTEDEEIERPNFNLDEEDKDSDMEAQRQVAVDQAEKEKAEAEKLAKEQAIADKLVLEQAAADRMAQEKAAAEKLAQEQAESENEFQMLDTVDDSEQEQPTINNVSISSNSNRTDVVYPWRKIINVEPKYPSRAVRSGDEGWVEVEIELDIEGNVIEAVVVNSSGNSKTFNRAAINAVMKWKYVAPISYGIEESQFKVVKIVFKL